MAVGGLVAEDAINLAGKEHFSNKVLIDATNPIAAVPPENGVLKFFTTLEESLMEKIQKQLPDAKVVKAFSCVGNAIMYKPNFNGNIPTMFICGNDEEAKKTVITILYLFWLGNRRHGQDRSSKGYRTIMYILVHSRLYSKSMDTCF